MNRITGEASFPCGFKGLTLGEIPLLGNTWPARHAPPQLWGSGALVKSNTVSLLSLTPHLQVGFVAFFLNLSFNKCHTFSASPASTKTGQAGSLSGSPKPFSPQASTPITAKMDKTSTTGSILNLNLGQLESLEVSFWGSCEYFCRLRCPLLRVVLELGTLSKRFKRCGGGT